MNFKLPELPYSTDSFSSFISVEGFNYHYGKHHQSYVNNLNDLVTNTKWETACLENIITQAFNEEEISIYNNAAQHYNHSFFWNSITPLKGSQPNGELLLKIIESFGTLVAFKQKFTETATKLFGSGWVWLVLSPTNKLQILGLKDAHTPLTLNMKPLMTLDIWEHAYYIDHKNARLNFIQSFWDFINWDFINLNLKK